MIYFRFQKDVTAKFNNLSHQKFEAGEIYAMLNHDLSIFLSEHCDLIFQVQSFGSPHNKFDVMKTIDGTRYTNKVLMMLVLRAKIVL